MIEKLQEVLEAFEDSKSLLDQAMKESKDPLAKMLYIGGASAFETCAASIRDVLKETYN